MPTSRCRRGVTPGIDDSGMESRRAAGGIATVNEALVPRKTRHDLHAVIDRLVVEYREWIPVGSIVRCVARSWEAVLLSRPAPADPVPAVEQLARSRLERRLSAGSWSIGLRDAVTTGPQA